MINEDKKIYELATQVEEPNNLQQKDQYLIFQLNRVLYGLDITNVIEIIEYKEPTHVPNLPNFVHGLLNLRGKVLPIVDFNLYLGHNNTLVSKKTCAVIIEYLFDDQVNQVGILVDSVLDVIELQPDNMEKSLDFGVNIKAEFVKNMVVLNEQIIILLDIQNVFTKPILEHA
jgi:purine-binding chemotaxis protein CheW